MLFLSKARGSISIFLILILMPMYTCAYLAIDSARYSAAQAKAAGAAELSGNAALADYDRTFKELYGIFAMSKSENEMAANLVAYYSNMIDSTELSLGSTSLTRQFINNVVNGSFENTINTHTENFSIAYESPVYDPETMEKAIRSFMKYRAPYNWTMGISKKLTAFAQAEKVSKVMDSSRNYYKSVSNAEAELKGLYNALKKMNGVSDNKERIKVLTNVKKILPEVKSELAVSEAKADSWSGSISELEEGEIKQLLQSEYGNSAGALSAESLDNFAVTLQKDIDALNAAESAEEDEESSTVELKYTEDPFFIYLTAMYGRTVSAGDDAQSQKTAMDTISSADLSTYSGKVASVDIPALVSAEIIGTIANNTSAEGISISGLSRIKDAALNSYEMEYIASMFGCLTTEPGDVNLMGSQFGAGPIIKGEMEYIVFGNDNMNTNVALCVDLIFAIRLIMNSIYVYTNANMRQSALAVATAIAGWTGIGIPVAQNAVLIAWATAESILDTASLCKGETVPIYKTASTWTLSLSNLPATLAKSAADYASKGIDDVFEAIENATLEKKEEAKTAALEYISRAGESAAASLTSIILTPVEKAITSLTSGVNMNLSRADVENAIKKAVESVDSSSSGVRHAKELFYKHCLAPLTDRVYSNLPSLFTGDETIAQQASAEITNAVNSAYSTLFSKVEGIVSSLADQAEGKITSTLDSVSAKAKEEAVNTINEYADSLSELIGETSEGSVSDFSGMGMTYRDYLKLFALIGLCTKSGKENMLKRCAVVMQINCAEKKSGFDITRCYRGVRLCTVTCIGSHTFEYEEAYHY